MNTRIARAENYDAAFRDAGSIQYIVVHCAEHGDTAQENAAYLAQRAVGTSVHVWVDGAAVWRSVLDVHTAWHCGSRGLYFHPFCRNQNSLGVALCAEKDENGIRHFSAQTLTRAAQLVQHWCWVYAIPPQRVLRHYDVTHAVCPEPFVRSVTAWEQFQKLLS